ncbi:hypothetical protein QQZ08_005892 [Neonectria magnoliae]|uniref:Uncharacterized protein n=1 Tax=Neonectria magnoliae TaxID=2732573 RepID=A0ABR1I289_9HYPO
MPYLYFSIYHNSESGPSEKTHESNTNSQQTNPPTENRGQREQNKPPTDPPTQNKGDSSKPVPDEIALGQKLFKAYKNEVIHQPSTLDEFYYHFATDEESRLDQKERNRTQVVTKYLRGQEVQDWVTWPLLRVSQLWIWVIEDKWLITSNSCGTGPKGDPLVQEILDDLNKKTKARTHWCGPSSATEMSRLIVDYCINAYDRKRKVVEPYRSQTKGTAKNNSSHPGLPEDKNSLSDDGLRKEERSIRDQEKPLMTERFQKAIKKTTKLLFKSTDAADDQSKDDVKEDQARQLTIEELRKATKTTARYLLNVKDIRDELNILKTIAEFQKKVQRKMDAAKTNTTAEEDLAAKYICNDIEELDKMAEKTQSAVGRL